MNDQELDYDENEGEESAHDFIEFVTKLSERNRSRQIRESIERLEESRRMREQLGLDGFELGTNY